MHFIKILISLFFLSTILHAKDDFLLKIFEDTSALLTLEEIQKSKKFSTHSNRISKGYTNSAFWFRFELKNNSTSRITKIIKLTENHTDQVDCYVVSKNGTTLKYEAGISRYTKKTNAHVQPRFDITLAKNESKMVYFRISSLYPHYYSFRVFEEAQLRVYEDKFKDFYSFYFGAIFALFLYNIFLYFFSRDRAYLFYVLYVSALLAWQMQLNGFYPFDSYSSSFTYYLSGISTPLFIAFFMFFSRVILDTKVLFPKIDRFIASMGYLYIFLTFLSLFTIHYAYIFINGLASFMIPFLLYVGFKSYYAGNKTALFYVVAQTSFLFTSSFFSFMTDGYIEYNTFTRHGIAIGSFIEAILFSLALAYKIRLLENEKLAITIQNNLKLEKTVEERTKELIVYQHNLEERVDEEVTKSKDKDQMLFHQNKLVSMGEMMQNIAHQWRQPLSQINSSIMVIDTIMEHTKYENNELNDKLLEIEELTQYMSRTISDFENFMDIKKEKKHFDLYTTIENAMKILKGTFYTYNIEVDIASKEALSCFGYPNELQQVLISLLSNAKDALNKKERQNKKVTIHLKSNHRYNTLSIADNAGGIDEKIIHRIFEPYFTTKYKSQSRGLGLYLSKMIIEESMGGYLDVVNRDEGCCFTIKLKVYHGA